MSRRTIAQLRELIALPSVSSTDPHWDQGNRAVIDRLAHWLEDLGFTVEIQAVTPDGAKANLIASLGSGPGGLVLAGHTDTVPFDEGLWHSDPLKLDERDNRLYGLGSSDMKGFFPLALAAAAEFAGGRLKHPLVLLATADEESSMAGARMIAQAGRPLGRAAIVGEPTGLRPVRMHKGIMMEALRIKGRSGHSSNPALGNCAIEGLHLAIAELLVFRRELQARYNDPLFEVPHPTLNLGHIHAGDSPNRICGSAELHFDLRLTPGSGDCETVREEIRRRLRPMALERGLEIEVTPLMPEAAAFEQSADSELVRLAERLTGHSACAAAFATEAPFMQQLGMETLVMGPGSIDLAHQPDEYLALDQIEPCIALLRHCIAHYCCE